MVLHWSEAMVTGMLNNGVCYTSMLNTSDAIFRLVGTCWIRVHLNALISMLQECYLPRWLPVLSDRGLYESRIPTYFVAARPLDIGTG